MPSTLRSRTLMPRFLRPRFLRPDIQGLGPIRWLATFGFVAALLVTGVACSSTQQASNQPAPTPVAPEPSGTAQASAEATPDPDLEPTRWTYREIGGQSLAAHVFQPASRDREREAGGVLLFHGGGWSVGSPEWTFRAARRFAEHGAVAIAVQYRLSTGEVTPIEALADVCAAFRWARDHADDLGLDPDRVAGYGVSAGGHLVTSTATVGCPPAASTTRPSPDLLLLWSPALDMTRDGWFERKLQGRAPAEAYSPLEHVAASTPPTSIVQGEADTLTPLSGAELYCQRLRAADGLCDLHVYPDVGHLLTRNLEYQEGDFDPDPEAVADGVAKHLDFLRDQGFLATN